MSGPLLGSLFTGYGGLDGAVAAHYGADLAWVCETDPAAAALLADHHPGVPNLGDVTSIRWREVAHRYPVDIITAGYP